MFLCFLKDKTYSSKAIFNPYLNKIILQNKHGTLNIGIYIQSPLSQTTLEAPRNFIFPGGQRNGFVVVFFLVFHYYYLNLFLMKTYTVKKKINNTS